MSGGYPQAPFRPQPRGLRPADAPHVFVAAPKFSLTGGLYLAYCLLVVTALVSYALVAVLLGLLGSMVASLLGPLALLGGFGMLAMAIAIMIYGVLAVRLAFRGNLTGVWMAVGHISISTLLLCAFYVIRPLDYIPPAAPPPPGSTMTTAPPPNPEAGFELYLRMLSLLLHFGPLVSTVFDVRRSLKYRRLEQLGPRLTLRDVINAGLVRDADDACGEPEPASISNVAGRPNAYGARRGNERARL